MVMHFLYMYISFDLQSEHISNYYEFYLLRTQQKLKIDQALNKADQNTRDEKRQANELSLEQLLR